MSTTKTPVDDARDACTEHDQMPLIDKLHDCQQPKWERHCRALLTEYDALKAKLEKLQHVKDFDLDSWLDWDKIVQEQKTVARYALADLVGSWQTREVPHMHYWDAHVQSILELAEAFDLEDELPKELYDQS